MNSKEFNYRLKNECYIKACRKNHDKSLIAQLCKLIKDDSELFFNSLRIAKLENELIILKNNPIK